MNPYDGSTDMHIGLSMWSGTYVNPYDGSTDT